MLETASLPLIYHHGLLPHPFYRSTTITANKPITMEPVSITIAAIAAGAASITAAAGVGSLAHNVKKDHKKERRSATQAHNQSNQVAPSYNSHPVPQFENVSHYGTSGSGRVMIGPDGSILAGGSAPGDITFGCSIRTISYPSATTSGSWPSPNFNFNQSQPLPPQIPFFLMPPPQQQQSGFIQQSQNGGSWPASVYGGSNGGQRMIAYTPYGQAEEAHNTSRRARRFRR
jgi:hypothetical protein